MTRPPEDSAIAEHWQRRFDVAFLGTAINFRIIPIDPRRQVIDSVTACVSVIGAQGDAPVICWLDAAVPGKDFRFTASVTQLQYSPFPRFEVFPLDGRMCAYWLWPRPIRAELVAEWADLWRGQREGALALRL
jgi:hypothetical protein